MIRVLDAELDADAWVEILAKFPPAFQDIYFRPEYVRIHTYGDDTRGILFVWDEGSDVWISTLLKRPIRQIGQVEIRDDWCDLETPYGYGGPIATSLDPAFLTRAQTAYVDWCESQGVVAEFTRFHPLLQNQKFVGNEVTCLYDRDTFSISLDAFDPESLPFSSSAKSSIRRASRGGLEIEQIDGKQTPGMFQELYAGTMRRLGADPYYDFNSEYFAGLGNLVQERGWLVKAGVGKSWSTAATFLRGITTMHYHLSASSPEAYIPGATNFLISAAANIGKESGLVRLHLGGGLSSKDDDSLMKFKRSMSTDRHPFYIGKTVHLQKPYDDVCRVWSKRFPKLDQLYGNRLMCYRYEA